ncbi:MAG: metallophosphoesterase family protein [Acidobacteriota bacterium]
MCRIGVISDTHRLVRPEILTALEGVEHIIHAGDMGSPDVIAELRRIAPVTAIRGNADAGDWAREFPETAIVQAGGIMIYVIHNIDSLDLDPRASEFSAVVYGHSHVPMQQTRDGVLYFNPGSAGPRRFHLPVSMGYLTVRGKSVSGEIILL